MHGAKSPVLSMPSSYRGEKKRALETRAHKGTAVLELKSNE